MSVSAKAVMADRKMLAPARYPPGCPRRGLSRIEAALYLGISPSKFDKLRKDGRVPPARLIDGRKVWDLKELDFAFEAFPLESNDTAGNEDWTAAL